MTKTLENAIDQIRQLVPEEQDRLAQLLYDFIEEAKQQHQFDQDMQDPEYKAYVERELAAGQADIEAGRVSRLDEVFDRLTSKFALKHGL